MPKKAKELGALEVGRLTTQGRFPVGGVAGLCLKVSPQGARSWVLRVVVGGKRRDIGLGGFPDVPLALAREKARQTKADIEKGIDPVAAKAEARSALLAARAKDVTFKRVADECIKSKSAEWKNAKHEAQWRATLETYAFPVVGNVLVRDIDLPHILEILRPIWETKTETASRLRGRIEQVIDFATVHKYRDGLNPARWKGHLDAILPKPGKIAKVRHHPAMPYTELADFMRDLSKTGGISARALEFAILTANRSGEVRGATWAEIDLKKRLWIIPAERMKAGKQHRVPLTQKAIEILKALPRLEGSDYVFPAPRGGQLSDMALTAIMRRKGLTAVPHGFRSTFRDWAGETTAHPREVIEHALAHQLKDEAEAAYARGDLIEKRRRLMDDWAQFCYAPALPAKVVKIR